MKNRSISASSKQLIFVTVLHSSFLPQKISKFIKVIIIIPTNVFLILFLFLNNYCTVCQQANSWTDSI